MLTEDERDDILYKARGGRGRTLTGIGDDDEYFGGLDDVSDSHSDLSESDFREMEMNEEEVAEAESLNPSNVNPVGIAV